jgi:uncharacterized iron-regulated protein
MWTSLTVPLLFATAIGLGAVSFNAKDALQTPSSCNLPVGWSVPGGEQVEERVVLSTVAQASVVLLGERHDDADHHRWQRETLQALHQRRPEIIIGLEMFPRRVQPALDAWVRGELDEEAFLRESDWDNVWRFDADLYMDIFRYAREHRLPMRALNVEAEFTSAVGRAGYDAIAPSDREGITKPAEASSSYARWLGRIFRMHHFGMQRHAPGGEPRVLNNFIEAQLVWDRAMAQGIRDALAEHPGALVVGLMGSGHLLHGYGVPHQLNDLGVNDHATLLPWDARSDCRELAPGLAHAIYNLNDASPSSKAYPGSGAV